MKRIIGIILLAAVAIVFFCLTCIGRDFLQVVLAWIFSAIFFFTIVFAIYLINED